MEQVKIIQEGSEWVAVLPPHPDMPGEELGLPAPTEAEAQAEANAYNAIMQSALYKFEFNEDTNKYVVSLGKEGEKFEAELLADAYEQAQEAYKKRVSAEPPAAEAPKPVVKRGPRKAKANGGERAAGGGRRRQASRPSPSLQQLNSARAEVSKQRHPGSIKLEAILTVTRPDHFQGDQDRCLDQPSPTAPIWSSPRSGCRDR
jgi:hypothetical protein